MKPAIRIFVVVILFSAPAMLQARQSAPSPQSIAISDLFRIQQVQYPRITPDGHWVDYTVTSTKLPEDKTED